VKAPPPPPQREPFLLSRKGSLHNEETPFFI